MMPGLSLMKGHDFTIDITPVESPDLPDSRDAQGQTWRDRKRLL